MESMSSLNTLNRYSQSLQLSTENLTNIFRNKGLISSPTAIPEFAPNCEKLAISAVIIDIEKAMQMASKTPENIIVAMQLGKVGDKIKLALPGGAILSEQEQRAIRERYQGQTPPSNLFYQLAQEQLIDSETLSFSYPNDLIATSFTGMLRNNLTRELNEEMGAVAAKQVQINQILADERTTVLKTMGLPDSNKSNEIAEKLVAKEVRINEQGKLEGIYTTVKEQVAIVNGPVNLIEQDSNENEEAAGMKVFTLSQLVDISANSSKDVSNFDNYRKIYSADHDGIRNPSTTWGLRLFVDWLIHKLNSSQA
jgi:hypothetical protein